MSRDSRLFLEDILAAVADLRSYVADANRATLDNDPKTRDAVIRCLEVIGEAVKRLPQEALAKHPDVDWAGFARLRVSSALRSLMGTSAATAFRPDRRMTRTPPATRDSIASDRCADWTLDITWILVTRLRSPPP
jgi:uncharacterized protein with HEPN domain